MLGFFPLALGLAYFISGFLLRRHPFWRITVSLLAAFGVMWAFYLPPGIP